MVRETGWTLEYIDGLSMADVNEWIQVRDGERKAHNTLAGRKR